MYEDLPGAVLCPLNLNISVAFSASEFLSESVRAYLEGPVEVRVVVREEVV